jgi:hypothetical protein
MQGLPSPSLQPSSTTLQGTDVEAADDSDDIPCFVAGHIDATHNWHGYIGIFRLRASLQAASRSSSDGMTPKTSSAAAAAEQTAGRSRRRPPRLYYRFVYPILDAERRCCSSMSAVLYSEDQFDRLRVRMNCVQRMAVVLNPTSTSATVSAAQQHQVIYNLVLVTSAGNVLLADSDLEKGN